MQLTRIYCSDPVNYLPPVLCVVRYVKLFSLTCGMNSQVTQKNILELELSVLLHHHTFCSVQNFWNGKTFKYEEQVNWSVENFFQSKPTKFYNKALINNQKDEKRFYIIEEDIPCLHKLSCLVQVAQQSL